MDTKSHRALVKTAADILEADANPIFDILLVSTDLQRVELLKEGKWVKGRFEDSIRIDQPTHFQGLQGMAHAAVFRRRGNQQVVVNMDGTASHGTKGRLHKADADELRRRGFTIRDDNMVEWAVISQQPQVLFG